jgi:hypothetical protein
MKIFFWKTLIDIYVGLARGVGKYFKEDVKAVKISESKALITFP